VDVSQDNAVIILTRPQAGQSGFATNTENRLLSAVTFRPALRPILPPDQWYWDSFPGVKQLGHDVDHSLPSTAQVTDDWSHTSTPLMSYTAWTWILLLPLCLPLQMEVND
jgi:hypothetical protein